MRYIYKAPCGELIIEVNNGLVCQCQWLDAYVDISDATAPVSLECESIRDRESRNTSAEDEEVMKKVILQLDQYFAGTRKAFDLPLHIEGTTFRKKVWQALMEIPYGKVVTYSELAEKCGSRGGQRAVAQACSDNLIPIIIPCHRVVRSDGSLGGYTIHHHTKKSTSNFVSPDCPTNLTNTSPINYSSTYNPADMGTSKGTTPQGKAIKQYLLHLEQSIENLSLQ
ncbi:MAG: methylated-DNA--[protein]-cysteine S-methyltransferase [Bacteroides sp.]|nr:methylated-DNA--[protein]-cysteine S-methyltransferase [Bacteroides sp.]